MEDAQIIEAFQRITATLAEMVAERNDMVVGVTAALLDLYRVQFDAGKDSKHAAIVRLKLQVHDLEKKAPGAYARYLQSLIQSMETGKLDAAKLFREPVGGRG
jgi:hypothetical protein